MAKINFPNSPSNGQVFYDTTTGNRYVYDATNTLWKAAANTSLVTSANKQILYNSGGGIDGDSNFIYDNGNVGIGRTTAGYRLDVDGTINASSVLVNGSPISGSDLTPANNWTNTYAQAVGTAGNNYTNSVGIAGNNYSIAVGAAANNWANTYAQAIGTAGNNYSIAVGTAGNNFSISIGASGNNYTNTYAAAVGTAGNNYTNAVGAAGNSYATSIGVSSNNYNNTYAAAVGTAGNNYTNAVGTAGNNYTDAVGAAANNASIARDTAGNNYATSIGVSSNNYTNTYATAVGTAGNNYTNAVGTAGNNYTNTVGAAANNASIARDTAGNNFSISIGASGNNYTNTYAAAVGTAGNIFTSAAFTTANAAFAKANTGSIGPKGIAILSPVAGDKFTLFFTNTALTFKEVRTVVRGSGSPSVTANVYYGTDRSSGTRIKNAGIVTTSTTTGASTLTFDNNSMSGNSFVWLEVDATSGTVDEFSATVLFTI